MGRTVISRRDVLRANATLGEGTPQPSPEIDRYYDRLLKYIPPEAIVAYTAAEGVVNNSKQADTTIWAWVIFIIILAATPAYLAKFAGVWKPLQLLICTGSFMVWAFAYPAPPFGTLGGGLAKPVVFILYTFLIPLFVDDPVIQPLSKPLFKPGGQSLGSHFER